MTWRRIINRNGLKGGSYTDPGEWGVLVNMNTTEDVSMIPHYRNDLKRFEVKAKAFLGDLRRLEHDALDEKDLCQTISKKSGVDSDIVAAVLQEFFNT